MVAPAVEGIDLFKIAGRSISGWVPSLKTGTAVRQPFCSQLEERLMLWLEYHPQVKSYARSSDAQPSYRFLDAGYGEASISELVRFLSEMHAPAVINDQTTAALAVDQQGGIW